MVEPFFAAEVVQQVQIDMWAQKYKDLRDYAFQLPKFGTPTADEEVMQHWYLLCFEVHDFIKLTECVHNSFSHTLIFLQVNELAYWVAENMNTIARDVLYNSDTYKSLQQKHSVGGKPFVMQVSLVYM